jgi:uncharacterized protein YdiU (UPF0061 family)
MSVLGLTIDYGPYGWLENFDPDWTPNTTDSSRRRYRYAQQPQIALWNLVRFAEALSPLVSGTEPLEAGLDLYERTLQASSSEMLLQKLGLSGGPDGAALGAAESGLPSPFGVDVGDSLIEELGRVLSLGETDMTIFFRKLADVPADAGWGERSSDAELVAPVAEAHYVPEQWTPDRIGQLATWLRKYVRRAALEALAPEERRRRMNAVNPKYVLRNYLAQTAIDAVVQGDTSRLHGLLEVLRHPYAEQPGREEFAEKRPDWARHRPGCSMLSCSS